MIIFTEIVWILDCIDPMLPFKQVKILRKLDTKSKGRIVNLMKGIMSMYNS